MTTQWKSEKAWSDTQLFNDINYCTLSPAPSQFPLMWSPQWNTLSKYSKWLFVWIILHPRHFWPCCCRLKFYREYFPIGLSFTLHDGGTLLLLCNALKMLLPYNHESGKNTLRGWNSYKWHVSRYLASKSRRNVALYPSTTGHIHGQCWSLSNEITVGKVLRNRFSIFKYKKWSVFARGVSYTSWQA